MLDTNRTSRGSPTRVNASHFCSVSSQPIPTRVVLLAGPSGSGKSSLAARSGLPVLRLDDFYKEADDPTLPRSPAARTSTGTRPGSWDADGAVAAIAELCRTGRTSVSRVRHRHAAHGRAARRSTSSARRSSSRRASSRRTSCARCQELGLLADALCLRGRPSTTFRRRLRAGSAGGPQVGAVPAAAWMAPDAGRAGHRGPPDGPGRVSVRQAGGPGPSGRSRGGTLPHPARPACRTRARRSASAEARRPDRTKDP